MRDVIYIIKNHVNEKTYIGSACYFPSRKAQHLFRLSRNEHPNKILQNFVNKYGIDKVYFEILESNCTHLIKREQFYIDTLIPKFNIRKIAESNKGLKRSPEQIKYMVSQRNLKSGYKKGYKLTPEHIENIKNSRLNNGGYIISEEQKQKHSTVMKGRKVSNETKVKISKKLKGREFSDEHKNKLSKSALGNKNYMNVDYKNPQRGKSISKALKGKNGKIVLNIENGFFYDTAEEAAQVYSIPSGTLTKHLSGYNKKNKTNLIYA